MSDLTFEQLDTALKYFTDYGIDKLPEPTKMNCAKCGAPFCVYANVKAQHSVFTYVCHCGHETPIGGNNGQ